MLNAVSKHKSPVALFALVAILIVATVFVFSNYFVKPGYELDIRNKIVSKLNAYNIFNAVINIEGGSVILNGIATNTKEAMRFESEIKGISGIEQVDNKIVIQRN